MLKMNYFIIVLAIIFYKINLYRCDYIPPYFQSSSLSPTTLSDKNFESVPTTVKVHENDTVLLPCHTNSAFHHIRWYRDGDILADTRNPQLLPVERVELFPNGSLQFSFVTMDDTGDYYCEIETANGLIARQFHAIEVLYPPTIKSNPSGYIDAKLGSVFEIVCEAHGVPNPIITWRVNDEFVTELYTSQNSYFVDVKNRTQAGSIECIANNGVNSPAVAGIILVILFAPEINATKNVVHTKIGLRADIGCYSTSNPAAAVHWFRRGSPLITDYRIVRRDHEMTTNESTSRPLLHVSKHILTIKYVQDTDLGTYECRAENKIGYSGAHIELTGRPLAPNFKSSPPSVDNSSYNLVWYTESISPIFMYELKFRQVPSRYMLTTNRFDDIDWRNITVPSDDSEGPVHTIFYSLTGLWPAHSYEVTVRAKNRYGWSDNSNIIRFITNGELEIPNYTTEIIEYNSNEEASLSETYSGSPPQSSLAASSSSSHYEKTTNKVKASSNANKVNFNYFIFILIVFNYKCINYL